VPPLYKGDNLKGDERIKRMVIQRSSRIESFGNSHRKLVVEEELEVGL
jgi:hypothetical protein